MDNRDIKDFKNFKPAAEPFVRQRQRPAAQAAAQMPADAAPAGQAEAPMPMRKRSTGFLMFICIVAGIVSALLLIAINGENGLLNHTDATDFGEVGMVIHFLVWGGILGFVFSLLASFFYTRLSSALPVYAAMLYLPFLLFVLTPLMCMGTELVIAIVGAIIGLIGAAIGLFLAWAFLCGG